MAVKVIARAYGTNKKEFIGLGTDTKPTDCYAGSTFYETDTFKDFLFDGTSWHEKFQSSTSSVIGKIGLQVGGADVSSTNQVYDVTPAYAVQTTITRSSTVTAYTSGQIILGNGASVLPTLDLSTSTGLNLANRRIAITGAFLVSNNGANSAFNGYVDFFNVNNPAVTTTLADYATFNPTVTALGSNFIATLDGMNTTRKYGTTSNLTMQTEVLRKCQLDSNGKLYFALVNSSGYTPANGETLTLILKFYLLN